MKYLIAPLFFVALTFIVGCASDPNMPTEDTGGIARRGLGESCTASEDCTSTLCVDVGGGHSVCTAACSEDGDCPGAGWGCVQPDRFDARICGCSSVGREICGNHVDDDCNARVDDCRMCGGLPVPEDDHANCGECGHACRADQECHAGACRCTDATSMECGGSCIDVSVSTLHCGSCTNVCNAGQICTRGTCGCPTGATACGSTCVDAQNDELNCGGCGHACQDIQSCVAGTCACPASETLCGGHCLSTSADQANCGSCGHACRADQSCVAGGCVCPSGQLDCGGRCIDARADVANCGACGHACEPGETCSASTCRCASALHCGGACIATSDPTNCGGCGNVCPAAQLCAVSACRCPVSSQTYCVASDSCVSLLSDPMNCGSCGHACDPATICTGGNCVCPASGQTFCAGVGCVTVATDAMHCGSCTNACAPNQICSTSACRCPTALPNLCPTVGCVAEATDPMNCGSCGNVCRMGETCASSSCRCPLATQRWCAAQGTCIDVASDPMNCGACGNVCPVDATCSGSACHCATTGETACGLACRDLMNDTLHCGTCTRSCTGSQICTAGACTCVAPVLGAERRLTSAAGASDNPVLAWNGTRALVAWIDHRSPSPGFYSLLLNGDGTVAGTEQFLAGTTVPTFVSVASNGVDFAVAMARSGSTTVTIQSVAADGTPRPITSSVVADLTYDMRIGYAPGVGYHFVSSGFNVDFTVLGAIGSPPSPTIHIRPGNGDQLALATAPGGEIGVLMTPGSFAPMYMQIVNADGSVTTAPTSVPFGGGTFIPRQPSLLHDGTTWVAAWFTGNGSTNDIGIARGPALASQFTVVQNAGNGTTNLMRRPLLVLDAGDFGVLWQTRATSTATVWNIVGERFAIPSTPTGPLTPLESSRVYMGTTTVADGPLAGAMTPAGLVLSWADTRWGSTEIYDELVTLPACAM